MTREEFIELSKTALAPALKGRRRPDGTVKIFYSKGGPSCIIPADMFGFQPGDTCEAKRQERLAGIFFDLTTNQNKEVTK
jgi:hypothetical protein